MDRRRGRNGRFDDGRDNRFGADPGRFGAAGRPAEGCEGSGGIADLYDNAKKDLLTSNGAKAITVDLDAWKQHDPDSEYKDEREVMYVQAYQMAKQWDKVLEKAKELMAKDLNAIYAEPKQGPCSMY